MSDPKGDQLVVNLSATETRRRLKGFGHGVRKIRSAGKNRALIIHTATGEHLAELESRFEDVGLGNEFDQDSQPIENLKNLGAASSHWLRDAGIRTIGDLKDFGVTFAFMQVRRYHPKASLNLLWAIAAGLQDRDWRDLSEAEKQELLDELSQ